MKKKLIFLFFIFQVLSFSNKGTYDVAKYRQDVINYAMAQVGKAYSQANRMGANTYDCSSFIDRSSQAAGMSSVTGANTKNWANTTASMSANAKAQKIPTSLIKSGDVILFNGHVVYALGTPNGCTVDVVHASNSKPYPKGGVKVSKNYNICKAHGGYLGVITAEQVLINNGYTPVNQNGQVITPIAGASVGSSTGNSGTAGDDSQKIVNSDYLIDLNAVLKLYVSIFDKGAEAIGTDLIIALTFIFALTFIWEVIKNRITNLEVIIGDFAFEFFKFIFFLVVIKNFPAINQTAMSLCFKMAEAFGSTLTSYYVLNEVVGYYAQNVGVLIGEFSRQAFSFAVITSLPVFVIIFCLIIYITLIFTYIIFQVVRAVMTYIIGTNFSLILLPFYFSRYSGEYIPNPFSVFFKCVAQLFFTILIISISLGVLSDLSKFLENTLKSSGIQLWIFKIPTGPLTPALDIMALCTYAVAFTMIALIMKKTLKIITTAI